ncbi:hypothetical protein OU798_02720 [Prolixibacteraceae bacterium Z1-6]|uniref:Helicase/UvrB N-terminal domain-containing protein n=1 Tax=Draconibacterium aestuarii TaxID=2998507 RepID=A0A9X3J3B6_9BACT|nr:hypothetical protein [Prolixibacteraceae bacterium Z1-6]
MIKILNNYCTQENGLLLFNPPTGSGKTHNVLKWIYENYEGYCKENKKIFFLTNLKKNLPYDELREDFFKHMNKEHAFDKHVTFLDSNSECLLKRFDIVEDSINKYFKNHSVFFAIKHCVTQINKHKKNPDLKGIIEDLKDKLRNELEPQFRQIIEKFLRENYRDRKERIKAIETNKELKWIGDLYPAVFSSKRKVFFLSIDKFYYKNSTLVEPSYSFLDSDITKDAIIFIDEFDATKDNLLNNIIEKGKKQRIDFIHLFTEIYWALSNNVFPQKFTTHSKKRKELLDKGYNLNLEKIQETLKDKAKEIVDRYYTNYSFKSTALNDENENQRNLLFHDFQYHSVYRNNKNFIRINTNHHTKVNEIIFETERPSSGENIVSLLNQIKGFVHYFSGIIKSIAENYQQLEMQERLKNPNRLDFTFDLALSSVIEEFGLESRYKNYIIETILSAREKPKKRNIELNYDFSIYENGFRYFDFVDNEFHQSKTKSFIYNFQNTPEKFIIKLAEKAKVIGISATALVKTVTGNYDISYFKRQLGQSFIELTQSEKEYLSLLFEQQNKNYKKVAISTKWLNFSNYEQDFIQLFEHKELASDIIGELRSDNPQITDYLLNRYLKLGYCFKQFLKEDAIMGFLCLLNKEPKWNDKNLNLKILEKIFSYLIEETTKRKELFENLNKKGEKKYSVKNSYTIINSSDFDNKKQSFISRLERNEKVFIISMYQTMGAGQNLQYIAPNPDKLVDVKDETLPNWNKENKTDINAIYLDKPTHLIQQISKDLNEEGFIKYLFQLEFLVQAGKISINQLNKQVTIAFKHLLASFNTTSKLESPNNGFLYNDENIKQHFAKFIIQALGRICRTNLKSKNIFIYADAELDKLICDFDVENNIVLKEFKTLVKSSTHSGFKLDDTERTLLNLANLTNLKINAYIKKFVNSEWKWKESQKKEWENLREMCLRFPTISTKEIEDFKLNRILDLYIEQPSCNNCYSYEQEGDYANVEIDFGDKLPYKVSQESIRLRELLEIKGVKNVFEDNKWATDFKENKYILPPELFNNIYKGAIGEQVGRFILENHFKLKLEELPLEHFELFDFKIKNENVYIDFKHWKEETTIDSQKQLEKIRKKLEKVNGDKACIINILSSSTMNNLTSSDGKIVEIPYLWNSKTKQLNQNILTNIDSDERLQN